MLEVGKDLSITISYGDILDVVFKINGLIIKEEAEFYLSIKKSLRDEEPLFLKQCARVNRETNSVRIIIESEDMKQFSVGKYYYDLVYKVGDNKRTLNYPARLTVREVAHDEYI